MRSALWLQVLKDPGISRRLLCPQLGQQARQEMLHPGVAAALDWRSHTVAGQRAAAVPTTGGPGLLDQAAVALASKEARVKAAATLLQTSSAWACSWCASICRRAPGKPER